MKKTCEISLFAATLAFLIMTLAGCKKAEITIPSLTTAYVTSTTQTTAQCGGIVISDGGKSVIERGVCWSTQQNPTIADNVSTDESSGISFTNALTGLSANTTYYIRAYATNSIGTGYGVTRSFRTLLGTVADKDGNVYNTIMIGTQVWMVENLRATHYADGVTEIPMVADNNQWSNLTTGAYCHYNNDPANSTTYGLLYNWWSAQSFCISGWHLPTYADWFTLATYLGNNSETGDKMKEPGTLHWNAPNNLSSNESGFLGLPGGYRAYNGSFYDCGYYGYWWSSTEYTVVYSWFLYMRNTSSRIFAESGNKTLGFSVRYVKD